MRSLSIVLASFSCLVLSGCVQYATLVEVNGDGSGTITLRLLKGENADGSLYDMLLKDETKDAAAEEYEGLNPTEKTRKVLESYAKDFGEGVVLTDFEEVSKQGWTGFLATFSFTDINKIKVPFSVSEKKGEQIPYQFKMTSGDVRELTISVDEKIPSKPKSEDPFDEAGLELNQAPRSDLGFTDAIAIGVAKVALTGARFTTLVKINGKVIETNAEHRPKPTTIMLQDFDVGEFAKSEEFPAIVTQKWDYERMVKEKVPGLKALGKGETITVKFSSAE